jgi:preprotein translocase subunit YajC
LSYAASQQLPPSGRPTTGDGANGTQTTQPATPDPASPVPTRQDPTGMFGGSTTTILMAVMMVVLIGMMLWTSRSQQKKQEAAVSALKKGDRVLTHGGVVGKLVEVGERYAKLEIAPGVKIEVLKTSLAGVDTGTNQPEKS